jgi:hypothetical protein
MPLYAHVVRACVRWSPTDICLLDVHQVSVPCRDSHIKSLYLAFGCYFYEFWNRRECHVSTDKQVVKKLFSSWEGEAIQASCMHLPGQTRICLIKGVLGTSLAYNSKVSYDPLKGTPSPIIPDQHTSPAAVQPFKRVLMH